MLDAIPFFIFLYIFNTEIRTQINHLGFGKDLFIYKRCTKPLWCCSKNHIYLIRKCSHIVIHTFCIYQFEKVLINICIFLINIASWTIPCHFYFFMSKEQSCKFISCITSRSDNSCFDHFSLLLKSECSLIRCNNYTSFMYNMQYVIFMDFTFFFSWIYVFLLVSSYLNVHFYAKKSLTFLHIGIAYL